MTMTATAVPAAAPSEQRRTLTLSNGEVIWDLSGNVWSWTAGTTSGGQPGPSGGEFRDWSHSTVAGTGSLSPNPHPSFGTPDASNWASGQSIGRIFSNSDDTALRGFSRGGHWNNGGIAGAFALHLGHAPGDTNSGLGFRSSLE